MRPTSVFVPSLKATYGLRGSLWNWYSLISGSKRKWVHSDDDGIDVSASLNELHCVPIVDELLCLGQSIKDMLTLNFVGCTMIDCDDRYTVFHNDSLIDPLYHVDELMYTRNDKRTRRSFVYSFGLSMSSQTFFHHCIITVMNIMILPR